jgi:methyl-accepting chemotaxis protein
MGKLGSDFEGLAQETSAILETARTIVGCAESERMASVLPRVAKLGTVARAFIGERLAATAGILDTVMAEAAQLERLEQLTRGQKAIVKETGMLRVLTNIEVARLGEVGTGFQYLAVELDDFSRAVARSTNELTSLTEERRKTIEETRRTLALELPQMREGFARMEGSLENAQSLVDATLAQMYQTPARFRGCVEEVAGKIAGVVAAIQAHDITRQQIEHVQEALGTIAAGLDGGDGAAGGAMWAGLAIQSYQLRNVQQTIEGWMTQIRTCLEGIAQIAGAELLNLSPMIMSQERVLTAQLTRIEGLEEECEAEDAKVQASFAGISGLMQLVSEHLVRSKAVRDRLQLLMFNSIVEASHLGTQADGILEISKSIKRISAAWAEITTQSEAATQEIGTLVEQSGSTLEAFSEGSYAGLREARNETEEGLAILRETAHVADTQGRDIEATVRALQARIAEVGRAADRLESCFGRLGTALRSIEVAREELEKDNPAGSGDYDRAAVEERFSASYTTEMERAVLRAALEGGPLPEAEQSFAGNSVELF